MRISDWSSDVCSSDLCGVQFEAEIAGRTAPLCLRANLGKLPYSAESPEARSLARVVLGASGRLRRGQILLTPDHDMMLEGEIAPPTPRTPARIIAAAEIGRASGRERGCQYV